MNSSDRNVLIWLALSICLFFFLVIGITALVAVLVLTSYIVDISFWGWLIIPVLFGLLCISALIVKWIMEAQ